MTANAAGPATRPTHGALLRRGVLARARASACPERGFTLLEIALAMMVAGILLTVAIPRLPRLGRTDLESSADRLASTMSYLADEASLRGRIYRLTLDLDAQHWQVAAMAPYAAAQGEADTPRFHEDAEDPLARSVTLPRGVSFDAVLDRDGETTAGKRAVYFLPEGLAEGLRVRLRENEGGARAVVVLDAALGSAHREDTIEDTEP